ncbi:DUF1707 SHOCT-like domain-containing protein [Nonomuraea lactucae]|uniref:DUF1707 SHOCT-like domain-containing protein n=1 Tax=Nonomuraea lactucae TaxID=2249762 RepID=UPI000DE4EAB3|nr:DUF1707 domain-containing protein [Nonomuraea lactucae]
MSDLPDRDPRQIRVSDHDRDRTLDTLRSAAEEGRLPMEEFHERLDLLYSARTYADLETITRDLPDRRPQAAPGPSTGRASGFALGFLGGFSRAGRWRAARDFTSVTVWGGGTIDLREAILDGNEIRIRAIAVMGGVGVIVPEDADVEVSGIGIMGGFDHSATGPGRAGGPRIVITGFALWGGVGTRRKKRKTPKATG